MAKGPFGGPRPGVVPEGEIVIHFEHSISDEEVMSLREAVLRNAFPLIVVRQEGKRGDSSIVFKMDGEAITLDTMREIKTVAGRVTDTTVSDVEVVFG